MKSLQAAVADLKSNRIDVLVTAPINKDCVREAGLNSLVILNTWRMSLKLKMS